MSRCFWRSLSNMNHLHSLEAAGCLQTRPFKKATVVPSVTCANADRSDAATARLSTAYLKASRPAKGPVSVFGHGWARKSLSISLANDFWTSLQYGEWKTRKPKSSRLKSLCELSVQNKERKLKIKDFIFQAIWKFYLEFILDTFFLDFFFQTSNI